MALSALHQRIHDAAVPMIRQGTPQVDPVPAHGDPRWGLSLVAIPDESVRRTLAVRAAELAEVSENPHVAYLSPDLHVTVRSLEGFASHVDDDVVRRYSDRVREVLHDVNEIEIGFQGLFLTSTGVVTCGLPDDNLQKARERLAVDADQNGWMLVEGGDSNRVRNTAHASLMVFRQGKHRDDALVDAVNASCDETFGTMLVHRLALVTYVVTESSVRLVKRAEVEL